MTPDLAYRFSIAASPILENSILAYLKSACSADSFSVLRFSISAFVAVKLLVVNCLKSPNSDLRVPISAELALILPLIVALSAVRLSISASAAVSFPLIVALSAVKVPMSASTAVSFSLTVTLSASRESIRAFSASSSLVLTLSATTLLRVVTLESISVTACPLAEGSDRLPVITATWFLSITITLSPFVIFTVDDIGVSMLDPSSLAYKVSLYSTIVA